MNFPNNIELLKYLQWVYTKVLKLIMWLAEGAADFIETYSQD